MLEIALAIGSGFAGGLFFALIEQRRHTDTLRAHYWQLMEHLTDDGDDRDEADFWKFESRN